MNFESFINFIRKEKATKNISLDFWNQVEKTFELFKIKNKEQFLAQTFYESGGYRRQFENLNYSATALLKVFPKYFPNKAIALKYERNPVRIANKIYANRMENGPPESEDGWKYRGRGFIQLTGKRNYRLMGEALDVDLVGEPSMFIHHNAFLYAGFFWINNDLNDIDDMKLLTKRINGGYHGLKDRVRLYNSLKKG